MGKISSLKNFAAEYWHVVYNYINNLDSVESVLFYSLVFVVLFYLFYRLFGAMVALAFIFAIGIAYLVYMSNFIDSMNRFDESTQKRMDQMYEEVDKDNPEI
jgi:hypothetical protein